METLYNLAIFRGHVLNMQESFWNNLSNKGKEIVINQNCHHFIKMEKFNKVLIKTENQSLVLLPYS